MFFDNRKTLLFSLGFSVVIHIVIALVFAFNIHVSTDFAEMEAASVNLVNIDEFFTPPPPSPTSHQEPIVEKEKKIEEIDKIVKIEEIAENIIEVEEAPSPPQEQEEQQKTQAEPSASPSGRASAQAQVYIKNNYLYIQRRIKNNLIYPAQAKRTGVQGTVDISFIMQGNGQVHSVTVHRSSGQEILDSAAIEAVYRCAPFRPPPHPITVIIPITFTLR
jgi:protein TonB